MILTTTFIFGLLIGSFLNVIVLRIEKGETFVRGRSKCPNCKHELSWFENIPIFSYILLLGKCRKCKVRISWQYPLVELLTGSSFIIIAFIANYYGFLTLSFFIISFILAVLACFGILIAVYDTRTMQIPNIFLWGINGITIVYLLSNVWLPNTTPFFPPSPVSSFLGALVAGMFFFFLVSISKETWMGWGDVWLGTWGGMLLGVELTQLFITLSFSFGAIVGIGILLLQKKTLKTAVPFGPYIILSGFTLFALLFLAPQVVQFVTPWLPGTI